jgi:hypothetical protein
MRIVKIGKFIDTLCYIWHDFSPAATASRAFFDNRSARRKSFFENANFACGKRSKPNRCYRLRVPRCLWDRVGQGYRKFFFQNFNFGQDWDRNPNPSYRLSVPRDLWDTLGHGSHSARAGARILEHRRGSPGAKKAGILSRPRIVDLKGPTGLPPSRPCGSPERCGRPSR